MVGQREVRPVRNQLVELVQDAEGVVHLVAPVPVDGEERTVRVDPALLERHLRPVEAVGRAVAAGADPSQLYLTDGRLDRAGPLALDDVAGALQRAVHEPLQWNHRPTTVAST